MAAFPRECSSSESSKAYSRQRNGGHGRRERVRRARNESPRSSPSRGSPPCAIQRGMRQQLPTPSPTPITTPTSSSISLALSHEHSNGITMERTHSGNSILSDKPYDEQPDNTLRCRDEEAAQRVKNHFTYQRKSERTAHERILRRLIKLDDPLDQGFINDESLGSIITAADSIFFGGALKGRVQWDWSSEERYRTELIGTTALRHRPDGDGPDDGGIETLIVLSEPILRNPKYDRRLLLSAFLHELVHCYLFILCGFEARMEGGHTPGFHKIARIIDDWVGGGYLSLCNMKANLNHFRNDRYDPRLEVYRDDRIHRHEGRCNQSPRPERSSYGYL